jgi:PPM family protein phosphatase
MEHPEARVAAVPASADSDSQSPPSPTPASPESDDPIAAGPDDLEATGADFVVEPAAPEVVVPEPAVEEPVAPAGELEELTLPSTIAPPAPLPAEAALGPDGRVRVMNHLGAHGRVNRYRAMWRDDAGLSLPVELWEAPAGHEGLRLEAEVRAGVRFAMLPRAYASFEQEGRAYLATDPEPDEAGTLEDALRSGMEVERAIATVLQLAQALRRLQQAGWVLAGLSPADVRLGDPLRIVRLGSAIRLGQAPAQPLHVPGLSAPELAETAPVTGKEDVHTLGAILFRAAAGRPLPESGAETAALPMLVQVPGLPQLLARALAPAEERLDLETFYRELLALKRRLSERALALEVASATSVGLNPTRLVNEDSCGYVTWSVAGVDGLTYRALLVVADGMGGMEAGEVASQTALRTVLSAATIPAPPAEGTSDGRPAPDAPESIRLDLVGLIKRAAPAVHAAGQGREMGTTLTCVEVTGGELTLAHVGDTRAYLLRAGTLAQLTVDHSLVAAMVTSGVLSKEEARGHPDSNKVLRSLGSQRRLPDEGYVDTLEDAYGSPMLALEPDDLLLLCSDGVWGSVPDEQIAALLAQGPDSPAAARALIAEALRAGAPDNAAALVARCVRAPAW